jgi:hypothetical protein
MILKIRYVLENGVQSWKLGLILSIILKIRYNLKMFYIILKILFNFKKLNLIWKIWYNFEN